MDRRGQYTKLFQIWVSEEMYEFLYRTCLDMTIKQRKRITAAEFVRTLIQEKEVQCKRNKS